MRSLFHSSIGQTRLESVNQIVPSAVTAALLQNRSRSPSTSREQGLEVAGGGVEGEQPAVGVADEDAAVGEVLEAERAGRRWR